MCLYSRKNKIKQVEKFDKEPLTDSTTLEYLKNQNALAPAKREELNLHDEKIVLGRELMREKIPVARAYQFYFVQRMLELAPNIERPHVLDYCCGSSPLYPHIRKKFSGAKYVGIDLSPKMLETGRQRYGQDKDFSVIQRDAEDLQLPCCFDWVIARWALHHLPDASRGLREISAVLGDGGMLILSEPAANSLQKAVRWLTYKLNNQFTGGHRSYTLRELKKLIKSSGYEIIEVRRLGLIAYLFGFPDILPFYRLMPPRLFHILIRLDEFVEQIPLLNRLTWSVIMLAKPLSGSTAR